MHGGGRVTCYEAPILADYWLAALAPAEEESVEEHLLACDRCGERLREIIALADAIRQLARAGSLSIVVTDMFLQRAAEEGLRVSQYAPPSGGGVQCTVTADDDLLIGRLAADFAGATRVDLALCNQDGVETQRLPDIPAHAMTRDVIFQEPINFAKAAPDFVMIARLLAVDPSGGERVLGEYTFNHKRTLPGPGAW